MKIVWLAAGVSVCTSQSLLIPTVEHVQAFEIPAPRRTRLFTGKSSSPSANYAIIYGEDGNRIDFLEENNDADGIFGRNSLRKSIIDKVDTQSLIRIGCAFSPSPHDNLHPKDVVGARLVSVDAAGVEIAVTVRAGEDGRCAQILVPVTFQTFCSSDDDAEMEECVLENLQQLDSRAYENIGIKEQKGEQSEQLEEQRRIIKLLKEEPFAYDLPDWWTFPQLNKLVEKECSLLKDLLNQGAFAEQVNALFQSFYSKQYSNQSPINTIKACVASVGTSGLFLRAFVEVVEEGSFINKELSIQFDEEAKSAEILRSNILGLVDAVQEEIAQVSTKPQVQQQVEEEEKLPSMHEEEITLFDKNKKNKEAEMFQRKLLEAQLQYNKAEKQAIPQQQKEDTQRKIQNSEIEKMKKEEAFQKSLLEARLRYTQSEKQRMNQKKRDTFQRTLLETQLRNNKKVTVAVDISSIMSSNNKMPLEIILKARQQPKSPQEEARLAKKYAEIKDVGERAYAILKDLYMV